MTNQTNDDKSVFFESAKLKLAASKENGSDVNLTNSEAQALYDVVTSMSLFKFSSSTPGLAVGIDQDVLETAIESQ